METNHVYVNGAEERIELALAEADRFSEYQNLSVRDSLRIRLLTEELLGMVRGLTGDYTAMFWIEGNTRKCYLHLQAKTEMSNEKRAELIAASTSGKNAAAKGLGGHLRNLIEIGLQSFDDVAKLNTQNGEIAALYSFGMEPTATTFSPGSWTLSRFRENLPAPEERKGTEDVWDQLEKSVLANLADDVSVGIRDKKVDITVEKKFKY